MAGHSKWANIKHRKGRQDKLRAKLFTRYGKEITIAARIGGADPDFNPRLRLALEKARVGNMPKDNIVRAIKKGTGELEGVEYQEITYEGYGPGGVAFIVDVVTDNKNRSASNVRANFSKNDGNLGENGSVSFLFDKKGVFSFEENIITEDQIIEIALESGAEDYEESNGGFIVYTSFESFENVRKSLEENNIKYDNAEISMIPKTTVKVEDEEIAEKLVKLYDALEDNEDVQEIYANFEIPDDLMEKIMS